MVSVLVSCLVERGFIGGAMVRMLVSSLVYGGFIGGVMVRGARLESGRSWVDSRRARLTITSPKNPRSTRLETSTPNQYTTDETTIYQTRGEHP
jgi:hypothetical protein